MMSDYIHKKFGTKPRGLWVPERVWAPDLAELFKTAGLEYSILDNIHLAKAGVAEEDMFGYFLTKYKRSKFAVFPGLKTLRYFMPFKRPGETMKYFKKEASKRENILFTYGDDAEKFGLWPGTNEWVYKEKWLDNFFVELVKNRKWLKTVTFSEYMDSSPPTGEVKIPEASYDEMLDQLKPDLVE